MVGWHAVLTVVCLGMFVAAATFDIASRLIPNIIPLMLVCAGLALRFLGGDLVGAALAGSAVFILCTICWGLGWLGGGDVKLLGGGAVAVPPGDVTGFILGVGLCGGVLAMVYLIGRRFVPEMVSAGGRGAGFPRRVWRIECWRIRRGGPLPYAVAIAVAGVFVLLQGVPS